MSLERQTKRSKKPKRNSASLFLRHSASGFTDNGKAIENVTIFPIFDDRDPRKTWDSIVRNFNQNWKLWLDNYGGAFDFNYLLPFGEFGTGDYFCFDYSHIEQGSEARVVVWLHETGRTKLLARDFAEFVKMAAKGDLDY